jgi:hypothetical protein
MDDRELLEMHELSGIELEGIIERTGKIFEEIDRIGHLCNGMEFCCREISGDDDIGPIKGIWGSEGMAKEEVAYHRLQEEMMRADRIRSHLKNIQDQVKETLEQLIEKRGKWR